MEERRKWQKRIFAQAKAAGITDRDDLHALVSSVCGRNSLKEITRQDYLLIIREIEKRSPCQNSQKKSGTSAKTRSQSGMSEGQIRLVWHLMYELKKFDRKASKATIGERLCGIIKREIKIDSQPGKPFLWLTYQDGITLIERLKKYVYNAEKRYLRGDRIADKDGGSARKSEGDR